MTHARAKLTPQGRLLLVSRVLEMGWSVPMAAEAMGDPSGRQVAAEVSRGELRAVVGPQREHARSHGPIDHGGLHESDRLVVTAAKIE